MRKSNNNIVADIMQGASLAPAETAPVPAEKPAKTTGKKKVQAVTLSNACASALLAEACRRALENGTRVLEGAVINEGLDALRASDTMDGDSWPFAEREGMKMRSVHLTPENYEWARRKSILLKADAKPISSISEVVEYAIMAYIG